MNQKMILHYATAAFVGGAMGGLAARYVLAHLEVKPEYAQDEFGWKFKDEEKTPDTDDTLQIPTDQQATIGETQLTKKSKVKPIDYHGLAAQRQAKRDLKELAKQYLPKEPEGTETPVVETVAEVISGQPYVINMLSWTNEARAFSKLSWTFYDEDDTLCDEHEEIVSNPDNIVGPDALLRFGEGSDDPDVVYVRNVNMASDYEISRVHAKYSREVLGIIDVQPRKPARTRKVKKVVDEEPEEE